MKSEISVGLQTKIGIFFLAFDDYILYTAANRDAL